MSETKYNQVEISKTMSWILRHGLHELNLVPDNNGRIQLKDLLDVKEIKKFNVSEEIIRNIVDTNDKKRFNLEEINGIWMIGANQGHSKDIGSQIDNTKLMKLITEPYDLCIHGTNLNVIEEIIKNGLKIMSRTHIHFASGYPTNNNVISGARKTAKVFVEIDMKLAMENGIQFYLSKNGVILTDGINGIIEPKYFKNIVYL